MQLGFVPRGTPLVLPVRFVRGLPRIVDHVSHVRVLWRDVSLRNRITHPELTVFCVRDEQVSQELRFGDAPRAIRAIKVPNLAHRPSLRVSFYFAILFDFLSSLISPTRRRERLRNWWCTQVARKNIGHFIIICMHVCGRKRRASGSGSNSHVVRCSCFPFLSFFLFLQKQVWQKLHHESPSMLPRSRARRFKLPAGCGRIIKVHHV